MLVVRQRITMLIKSFKLLGQNLVRVPKKIVSFYIHLTPLLEHVET